MIGNTVIQVPSSSMIACPRGSPNGLPYLSPKPRTRHFPILTLLMVNHFQMRIEDDKIIIPKNSLVEVNQSGLLMETMIDIMPRDPLPEPSLGPLHPECGKEGLIVCDRQKIKGEQGVSLDELVGIFTSWNTSLTQASEDLRKVNSSIMTPENTELIQKSIYTLVYTLKKFESTSSDILGFTGDEATRKNLQLLIKSLSRLL